MVRSLWAVAGLSLSLMACGGGDSDAEAANVADVLQENTEAGSGTAAGESGEPGERVVQAPEGSLAGNPMIIGAEDAPLTIIEYASLTCPGCASFHTNVFPEIKERYIDTGLVRFEYREFPTAPQNLAYAAAYMARCSATTRGSGAYFAMIDTLYERQREWAYGPEPGATLEEIAAQAGINREGLEQCFFREEIKEAVSNNIEMGLTEHEVTGTPTFIVDDEVFDWGRSVDGMIEAIDRELAARQQ